MTSPVSDTAASVAVARRVLATEIEGLAALSASIGPAFAAVVDLIAGLDGRVICAGVGKSGHVARKIAATLASTGTPAMFIHPTEASHGDMGMIGDHDAVLALSKSGDVPELSDLLAYASRFSIPLIGMTAREGSALGKASDHLLLLPDAPEACAETRAPTTSTTMQIALGDALAVALLERRGFTARDFRVFHPGGKLGAMLKTVGDLMHVGEALPLVRAETPMLDALLVMTAGRLGCTGVADAEGRLVGIITDGDVRRRAGRDFTGLKAGEVMTPSPMVIAPDALAADALGRLNDSGRTVLFAVDEGGVALGVLHLHDLLRAGVA
jgi:arabinose-5-phosphate isomerase